MQMPSFLSYAQCPAQSLAHGWLSISEGNENKQKDFLYLFWHLHTCLYSDSRNVDNCLLFLKQEDRSVETQFDEYVEDKG